MPKQKPPLLTMRQIRERGLWFASKHFGFGWVPVTRQGWLVLLGFVVAVILDAFIILPVGAAGPGEATITSLIIFFIILIILIIALVTICIKKGERAYWRWLE